MHRSKYSRMTRETYAEWRKANRPKTYKDCKKDARRRACRKAQQKAAREA